MNLDFDKDNIRHTQFGIGRDASGGQIFNAVAVDQKIQAVLLEMAKATVDGLERISDEPVRYEPSEKYGSTEHLYLPIDDDMVETLRQMHEATNIEFDGNALKDTNRIFCYFARFKDVADRNLTALRRSYQFKILGKSKVMQLLQSDSLTLVESPMFKLDNDFDFLIDASRIHILRPSGFEFTGRLQRAIQKAAPENIEKIQEDLPFVNFESIKNYALRHPRAARYVASIRSQNWTKNVDNTALKQLCIATNVEVVESDGRISVDDSHVMGFLEVLDRRRYEIGLVPDSPEHFRAASRQQIKR